MRIVSLLIVLFIGISGYAQNNIIQVDVAANDEESGKRLDGAVAEIFQDGKLLKTVTSASNGKFPIVELPLGYTYVVYIKKSGYVTKVAQIDGHYDYPEDLPPITYVQMQTSLFKVVEGIDFSFLETTPMIKFAFTPDGYQDYDKKYTKDMLVKIENLKQQMELQRQENLKKEQEQKKRQADFDAYMKAGDAAMNTQNYEVAITQYDLAVKLMPEDATAKSKLEDAKKKLAEKQSADAAQKEYSTKMEQAKIAYTEKRLEDALALYKEANKMKPDEALPKERIATIETELKNQKEQAEQFNKLVTDGDAAMNASLFDDAITKYTAALAIKADPAVQIKLDNAKKKKTEKEQADLANKDKEAKYAKIIADADLAFGAQSYDVAKAKYVEAIGMKPGEPHPTERLKQIEDILKKKQEEADAANKLEADFKKLIGEADALFTQKSWQEAKSKYETALKLKQNDPHSLSRIDQINQELEKLALDTKKNEEYNSLMAEAKSLFDQKKYIEAKAKYTSAISVKSNEQEPKDKISQIDKILADTEKQAQLEKDYQQFITEGNSLKEIKDYTAAIDRYNKALVIKPADPTATQKIAEINKIIEDQKKEVEKQKQFDELMVKATTSFNAKDYTTAKMNYQKAFEIIPDPTIPAKIKEIDDLIAKNQNETQLQAKYDTAIKEADALYSANKWEQALAKYEEAVAIKSNESYPKEKISELKEKIANQKDQAEKEKKFNDFVVAGDAAFTAKDYSKALSNYQEAIKVKPDATISQKIGQINTLILEQNQNQQVEERYKAKIAEADVAFKNKSWESAKQLYKDAQLIKSGEVYPANQIAEIEKQMQAQTDQEAEKNYQKIIEKANALKNEERFDEAIAYYQNALQLRPSDTYPKDQIAAINKIKADRASALSEQEKLDKEYTALLKSGDEAFNAQNWTIALAKYKEALLKKPGEVYPQNKIVEINSKMSSQTEQQKKDNEYNGYIAEADALFNSKKYLESIAVYKKALGVKGNEAYPKNQIEEATRLEQANSVDEVEVQYQNILNVAQQKFDEGDYAKALELYNRAKSIRPSDPLPQKRIDEINQVMNNRSTNSEYDVLIKQADFHFEKADWQKAKDFYKKALEKKTDSYPENQIKIIDQKMQEESVGQVNEQYNKLIAKADEYFDKKDYTKAIGLYERAIGIKPSDIHPKNRLDEIDRILNPGKYVATSNGLNDYGKPVNISDVDAQAMLLDAEDQRKYLVIKKAEKQRLDAEDANQENTVDQVEYNFDTEDHAKEIRQDLDEKEWVAEVKRTESNLEVIEMEYQLNETYREWGVMNENDSQQQNQIVNDLTTDVERRDEGNDLPREEYLADVERIKIEASDEDELNTRYQTDATYDQKSHANKMEEEHISSDPNNDVDRMNGVVYVEDLSIQIINESNKDSWSQEDDVMSVKDNTEVLVDEQMANNIGNDIPREEGINKLQNYVISQENNDRNNSNSQYDATIDQKNHAEHLSDEIVLNNLNNDIPRQKMELSAERSEIEVGSNIEELSLSQNAVVNRTDDKLDNMEISMEKAFVDNDQNRENFEKEVVSIDDEILDFNENMSESNENSSYSAKDHSEKMTNDKVNSDIIADTKSTLNADKTNDAVEDIIENNKLINDGNDEEVDAVEDYVEDLRDLDPVQDNGTMKNELGQKYPEGVTEEVFAVNDENGLLSSYIVRRIVVIDGTGHVYEKVQTRYGGVSYTLDGYPISEFQWSDQTQSATLTRN